MVVVVVGSYAVWYKGGQLMSRSGGGDRRRRSGLYAPQNLATFHPMPHFRPQPRAVCPQVRAIYPQLRALYPQLHAFYPQPQHHPHRPRPLPHHPHPQHPARSIIIHNVSHSILLHTIHNMHVVVHSTDFR
eukprot:GHVS01002218.1.p1 GENE.GHVS01002218.1~~GHVS01002218.1.p1  ORF type:complete len:131 (-),score=12.45 GHVS01002218.1:124-516(-)